MRFRKYNIDECLFSTATKDYAGRLNFECKDGAVRNGVFSRYCIGISHYLYDHKLTVLSSNKIEAQEKEKYFIEEYNIKHGCSLESSYKTYIYDIAVDNIENNVVYGYYLIGEIDNNDRKIYKKNVLNRTETLEYFRELTSTYFLFNNELYYINTSKDPYKYTHEQLCLLLKESIYKENLKFDKLKKQIEIFEKISDEASDGIKKREPIPEEVKFEVWRRDEGKCVICGSKEKLEFDHIIPFSKGGGNTVRNLQLLCESCNRKKSDKI